MKPLAVRYITLAYAALITGCAGTTESAKPPIINAATPLSALSLKDTGLRRCVEEAVKKFQWKTLGEVTSLDCRRTEKRRLGGPQDDATIKDLSEIKYFTALKDLDVAGNFYTKIDTSALVQLERLDLYEAFITELDVSKNTRLKSLNIGATGITQLDLRGLKNLEALYVSYEGEGYNSGYTDSYWQRYGDLAGLTLQQAQILKRQVSLDPGVKLEIVETGANALLDIPDNSALNHAFGHFTLASISGAALLVKLNVEISGSGLLDLSNAALLEEAQITSNDIHEIRLAAQLAQLDVSAPITNLDAPATSRLTSLQLTNTSATPLGFNFNLPSSLVNLTLENYAFGKSLNMSNLTALESIAFIKPSGLYNLGLPNKYVYVSLLEPQSGLPSIVPASSILGLRISDLKDAVLRLDPNMPNLEELSIKNCAVETLNFSPYPYLTKIEITSLPLQAIDLTPFAGRQLKRLYLLDLGWDQEMKDQVRQTARNIFKELYIN